jgi:hypothetical protein
MNRASLLSALNELSPGETIELTRSQLQRVLEVEGDVSECAAIDFADQNGCAISFCGVQASFARRANHRLVCCASAEIRYVVGSLLAGETEVRERALMEIRAIWSEYRLQLSDIVEVLNSNGECVANFSVADAAEY